MANEQTTDATNSSQATPTGDGEATTTPTSTTEGSNPNSENPPKPNEGSPGNTDLADAGLLDSAGDKGDGEADGDAVSAEGAEGEGEAQADQQPALIGAPEGDYELTLPEGMALDTASLEAITPLAKELNLSNAGLTRLATEALPLVENRVMAQQVEAVVAQRKEWETDARSLVSSSPVFAGENMDAVMTAGARAMDRFTNDENGQPRMFPGAKINAETGAAEEGTFRDFLRSTGLGNHPAMIQFAYLAGKAIGEDSDFERHGSTPQTKLSREEKYYGDRAAT